MRGQAACSVLPADVAEASLQPAHLQLRGGQALVREGDVRRHSYTVKHGALRQLRLLADGRRLVAGFLMPGDYVGFSGSGKYRHAIEAIVDSELCVLPLQHVRETAREHPEFGHELLDRAVVELDATRDKLMTLARMTPLERVAGFLLDMAWRRKREGGDGHQVVLPMSRTDIADYLGLTIETVSRCFTKLRTQGLIATDDPQHVHLLKPAALAALAEQPG